MCKRQRRSAANNIQLVLLFRVVEVHRTGEATATPLAHIGAR